MLNLVMWVRIREKEDKNVVYSPGFIEKRRTRAHRPARHLLIAQANPITIELRQDRSGG